MLACGIRHEAPAEAIELLEAALHTATTLHIELTASQVRRELSEVRAATGDHRGALALVSPALRRHVREGSLIEARSALTVSVRPLAALGRAGLAAEILGLLEATPYNEDNLVDLAGARDTLVEAMAPDALAAALATGAAQAIGPMATRAAETIEALLVADGPAG